MRSVQRSSRNWACDLIPAFNLKWFIEQRWQPLRESTWRDSTKDTNVWVLSHIVKRFGTVPLEDADSVALQLWLNQLAKTYSGSLVRHVRIFLKSIFAEAVEQDYMLKNPARLLRIPVLKAVRKPFLTQEQIKKLLGASKGMDKVILRLLLTTGAASVRTLRSGVETLRREAQSASHYPERLPWETARFHQNHRHAGSGCPMGIDCNLTEIENPAAQEHSQRYSL